MTAAKVLGLENRRRTTTEAQMRDRHLDRKYIGDQVGFLKQMPSMGGDGRITCRKFKVAAMRCGGMLVYRGTPIPAYFRKRSHRNAAGR
jgi:hypothetical protein